MQVKTRKTNSDGLVRLETSGNIKEVVIKEDLLKPQQARVFVCFKGKSSSGIIEFSRKEIEGLLKEVGSDFNKIGEAKIIKLST